MSCYHCEELKLFCKELEPRAEVIRTRVQKQSRQTYHRIKKEEIVILECEHHVTLSSFLGFDRSTSSEPNSWPTMITSPFPSRTVTCSLLYHSSGRLYVLHQWRIGAAVPSVCSSMVFMPAWEPTAAAGVHIHQELLPLALSVSLSFVLLYCIIHQFKL